MMDRKQHAHLVDDVLQYILKRFEKTEDCWNWFGPLNSNKAPRFSKFVLGKKTHLSPHIVTGISLPGLPMSHTLKMKLGEIAGTSCV